MKNKSAAQTPGTATLRGAGIFSWIALGVILHSGAVPAVFAEVIVPGVVSSQLDPDLKGLIFIEELNCVACHAGDESLAARSKKAPRLGDIGSRANPGWLEALIGNPHGIKPGTTMPDVLTQLSAEEKRQTATALTHFLLSLKKNDFSLQPSDAVAAEHGKRLFHSRGCAACHSPRDERGAELLPKNSVPLGALERKYSFKSLVDFLRQPHTSRPSGRMPEMRLAAKDVERIAHYLLQDTRVPGSLGFTLYRGEVWEGLESEKVTAERAGQVNDFALESLGLGKIQQHTAIQYTSLMLMEKSGVRQYISGIHETKWRSTGPAVVIEDLRSRDAIYIATHSPTVRAALEQRRQRALAVEAAHPVEREALELLRE